MKKSKTRNPFKGHETKFAPVDLKRVNTDGAFEGYASIFGKEDMGRDVVLPGAFGESLKRRGVHGIKMLFQHDPNEPIGVWQEIFEDERGLFVKGQLMTEVVRAREVLSLMRSGALDGLSIGFRTVKGRTHPKTGIRQLVKIDLWEISVVTFPMLPEARVSAVKRWPFREQFPTEREFERWLTRDAGFTRSQARMLMHSGFKSLAAKQDAAGSYHLRNSRNDEQRLIGALRRAAKSFQIETVR